jgi:hypothetical protein
VVDEFLALTDEEGKRRAREVYSRQGGGGELTRLREENERLREQLTTVPGQPSGGSFDYLDAGPRVRVVEPDDERDLLRMLDEDDAAAATG